MKKKYNILFILGVPVIFLVLTSGILHHDGSVGGKTGSPGDMGNNCTGCHTGNPVINQTFWIYSADLGSTGYLPGQTYNVFVTGTDENAGKFGFEATAEDNAGNKVGTFAAGGNGFNQTNNSNTAITHTASGNVPTMGSSTEWNFTWTAPSTNVGDITMYAAINAANGTGGTSGDQIYLSQFTFSVSTVGVSEKENENLFNVFPVPSTGLISISNIENASVKEVTVMNLMGQVVFQNELSESASKIDLSNLDKGIYFVKIGTSTQQIILK